MSNKEIYLLSETQLGFYYEWIKNPDLTEYNVPYKLILSQSVDANRLEKALYRVLHNNPIYYTCIKLVNGNAYQFIDTDNEITVERIKASKEQLPEIEKEFVRPFNLHEGGLARFTIVETEDSTVLLEDMHHCVSDVMNRCLLRRFLTRITSLRKKSLSKQRHTKTQKNITRRSLPM